MTHHHPATPKNTTRRTINHSTSHTTSHSTGRTTGRTPTSCVSSFLQHSAATVVMLSTLTLPTLSAAGNDRYSTHTYTDYATVTRVTPQYRTVRVKTPIRECWTEHQRLQRSDRSVQRHRRLHNPTRSSSSGGTVIGGIVGGVIGHTLGSQSKHKGARAGATIAGAIIGSTIANESNSRSAAPRRQSGYNSGYNSGHRPRHSIQESVPVERCATKTRLQSQEKLIGYRVNYRYRGQQHTVTTRQHPGHRLPIEVSIRPSIGSRGNR